MGGWRFGAGRPGWRVKAEHLLQLDARSMARKGLIPTEERVFLGTWAWNRDGEEVGRLRYVAARNTVTVYAEGRHQVFPILRTACHYGGSRCWFGCPTCGRRVAILYWRNGGRFGCRSCHQVVYSTQAKGRLDRAIHRLDKVERRLGEGRSRPRGMHRSTYERMLTRVEENERAVAAELHQMLGLSR